MNQHMLEKLQVITEEERAILGGRMTINRDIYMQGKSNIVNAKKLLEVGNLITVRPHTRFVDFPEHSHDYVEVVYMCTGQTIHIVNGNRIELRQGELLFLNQSVRHGILEAKEKDLAVNFIVLPEFFNNVLSFLGEEETPLRRFLIDCLSRKNSGSGFLHFKVAQILPVQNLIENLLFTLMQEMPNRQKMSQLTMALLFLQLIGHTETLEILDQEQADVFKILTYVENHYISGSLTELAQLMHYDLYNLSRDIKCKTGKNYTQLVQEKRLAQAAFLLKSTDRNVDEIAAAVGYENVGYFHRIFKGAFGISPRNYRLQNR